MNILTFDVEEWYIYDQYPKGSRSYYGPIIEKYLNDILEILDKIETKATFFCLGIIARNDPEIIKAINERGHEIGCHSDTHILLNKHTPASFKDDTYKAIDSIQQLTGKKVKSYRAPAFSIGEKTIWALEALIEAGIEYDCSIFPGKRSFGGFSTFSSNGPVIINTPNGTIKELPVSYANFAGMRLMFSGGGYFRLFPYSIIKKFAAKSDYNMAYFHVRDFDSQQKKVYSLRYFQSYYGIKNAYSKFQKLVNDFNFISVEEAGERIDWDSANVLF